MIVLIKGRQRQYKTTTAIGIALELVLNGGYSVSDIVSNMHLYNDIGRELRTYHYVTIPQMRAYVRAMVERGLQHKIIIIDEIDRVFPHRFWQNKEQTETLLGLWQDEKLFNYIIGTAHLGLSVDVTIRECLQIEVISQALSRGKTVKLTILNGLERRIQKKTMHHVELIQRLFDTREVIGKVQTVEPAMPKVVIEGQCKVLS